MGVRSTFILRKRKCLNIRGLEAFFVMDEKLHDSGVRTLMVESAIAHERIS